MADFHIFAPIPQIRKRTRLAKLSAVLRNANVSIRYYGWKREKSETPEVVSDPGISETTILNGGGYGGSRVRLYYPLWMIAVFRRALRLPRGSTWYCLGFESAFPALLAAKIRKSRVIFDDADRFSMIVRLPGALNTLVVAAERWTSQQASIHIVPGFTRYEWRYPNMKLLRNSPTSRQFEAGRDIARGLDHDRSRQQFTLYMNGWIGETRGAPVFLALMEKLATKCPDVRMLLIGRGDAGAFDRLIRLPNVDYQTEVPQEEALAYYYASDLVLTYYDPAIAINRHAESNKWGDCVFCDVPFVVNSEVETAGKFVESGAAFAVEYGDVETLFQLVIRCKDDPAHLERAREALRKFRADFPPFDEALSEILSENLPRSSSDSLALRTPTSQT